MAPEAARLERVQTQTPAVAFDRVSLAFDDHVVLREISFSLLPGRLKVILGARSRPSFA
jgi:ABC-type uncharacterized transport system ATPase subunit